MRVVVLMVGTNLLRPSLDLTARISEGTLGYEKPSEVSVPQ